MLASHQLLSEGLAILICGSPQEAPQQKFLGSPRKRELLTPCSSYATLKEIETRLMGDRLVVTLREDY
jgi:hypothetical protein